MVKKYEYLEIEGGKSIHPGIAISQAVQLLDLAAAIATDARDVDRMVKVSTKWLVMGERLAEIMEIDDDDEPEEEPEAAKGYGFHGGLGKQIIGKEVEEIGASDED